MTFTGVKTFPFALSLVPIFLPRLPMNFFAIPPFTMVDFLLKQFLLTGSYLPYLAQWSIRKAFVFAVNYWHCILIYGTGIMLTNILIIAPICLTVAISIFQRAFLKLLETKQEESLTAEQINRVATQYRELQILAGYFNEAHKNCVVMLLITTVSGQVINMMGLLADLKDVGGLGLEEGEKQHPFVAMAIGYFLKVSYFEGVVLCVCCINFILGFCGAVHYTSTKFLKVLKSLENLHRNKLLRRLVQSMPPVMVKCGADNFVEKITPVVYQQFSNEKIVESLLLREK